MNTVSAQNEVTFRLEGAEENRCSIARLTRHRVVFLVQNLLANLRVSQVLSGFEVLFEGQKVYSGRAVLRSVVHAGKALVCEAELDPPGISLGDLEEADRWRQACWSARFQKFLDAWQREYRVLPEFKSVVADMQSFLDNLRLWLGRIELEMDGAPLREQQDKGRAIIDELSSEVIAAIDSFIDQFESIACSLTGEAEAAHRLHLRRQLHPLLLASPFAYRTFTKPLGYAGDYEVVDMMLRSPYEGASLFAKMINVWLIGQAPAEAHRNRMGYLVRKLTEETLRVSACGRRARVFNLGCGPAEEVRRFLVEQPVSRASSFTLVDFNEETIARVQERLHQLARQHRPSAELHFVRKSVQQILKEAARSATAAGGEYDLLYCAGLFDYLADPICQRLMDIFYEMLAPGGLILVTNVSDAMNQTRPFRYSMEYMLDWHLIYRDGTAIRKLAPAKAVPELVNATADMTGVNVFLEVRKPQS